MERELLLLGLLRQQGMHGYQLHEFIESYMLTCVDIKKPTAYYLLDKMAADGLVIRSEVQEGHRPTRHVYRLTASGESRFQELLRQNLTQYIPARFGGDVGVSFLDELPMTEAITLLQQRRVELAAALIRAQQTPFHGGSLQLIIEHHQAHLQAELTWLDSLIARLTDKNNNL